MDDLRVYEVEVTLKMYVVASSEAAAEEIAGDNLEEEVGNDIANFSPREVVSADDCEDGDILPWGVDNDDPRRNWSVRQWLESKGVTAND